MKILIRKYDSKDCAFIFATYLRNRWFDKGNMTTLKRATWSNLQHSRIEKLLEEQTVLVACLDEDPDTILGYTFLDGNTPFCYVKLSFRGEGFNVQDKLLKELNYDK